MPNYIITPKNNLITTSGIAPVLNGNTISWGGVVETFPTTAEAAVYYAQVVGNITAQASTTSTLVQDLSALPTLVSITPTSFIMPNSGAGNVFNINQITIRGYGFLSNTVGILYIEDVTTNTLDSNGYYLTCIYVSSNLLIANAGGTGDGVLPAGGVAVYYQDLNGVISNVLFATTDGTTSPSGFPTINF